MFASSSSIILALLSWLIIGVIVYSLPKIVRRGGLDGKIDRHMQQTIRAVLIAYVLVEAINVTVLAAGTVLVTLFNILRHIFYI